MRGYIGTQRARCPDDVLGKMTMRYINKFIVSTSPDAEPMGLVYMDTEWSTFIQRWQDRDALARWGRDAKPGDTYNVGKITVTCVACPSDID